jgi:hypothetical protein
MIKNFLICMVFLSPILVMAGKEDLNQGGCYAIVTWRVQNDKPTSKELLNLGSKYATRVQSVVKQAGACQTPQGNLSPDCLRTKLSASDYDLFDGFLRGMNGANLPQDPSKLPNHEVLSTMFCASLLK